MKSPSSALPEALGRQLLKRLAPAGAGARLSILAFHRVLAEPDALRPGEPTVQEFEERLRWVKSWFNVLPLVEAIARLRQGRLPERPLAITFDDGYADNYELALPVLIRLGLPATVFVASGYLDGGRMFNDTVIEAVRQARGGTLELSDLGLGTHPVSTIEERRAAVARLLPRLKYLAVGRREFLAHAIAEIAGARLPSDLMMRSGQLVRWHAAGMDIGGHTISHPILASIPPESARREIAQGRAALEDIAGARVRLFAYPNGEPGQDYHPEHVALVRELGFDAAVTWIRGAAHRGTDLFQLPRFTPWDRARLRFGLRLASNLMAHDHASA